MRRRTTRPLRSPTGAEESHRVADRVELFATIVLMIATILTAWSAFQASKWSGVQAIHFSEAAAARTESAKASTQAGQQTIIDVNTFTSWLSALSNERRVDPNASRGPDGLQLADSKAQDARDANQRGDNYILTTVIFAAVLFFGGVSSKLQAKRNQMLALGFAVLVSVGTVAVAATFPIEI